MIALPHAIAKSGNPGTRVPGRQMALPGIAEVTPPGDWKYRPVVPKSHSATALALLVSAGLHVLFLYGFNFRPAPPPRPATDDSGAVLMVMPELKDLDEPEPIEELSDDIAQAASVVVPTLIDMPTLVAVDSFVQPLDFRAQPTPDIKGAASLTTIPVNIGRGGRVGEKLGQIFDISQLDRVPEPMVQTPPVYPFELRRDVETGRVVVGFIVDSKGDVVAPYVVESSHRGFEVAAITGVAKWKFRPGIKGGKRVNTRMLVPIIFRLTDGQ